MREKSVVIFLLCNKDIRESFIEVKLNNAQKKNPPYFQGAFLGGEMENRSQREQLRRASLRQSSLTCFCSQARQWAASAACWRPDSTAAPRGPSAVEPVGETKQETSCDVIRMMSSSAHISRGPSFQTQSQHKQTVVEGAISWW